MSDTTPTSEDWTQIDPFAGPTLDEAVWKPVDLGSGPRVEPDAQTTVADGVLTVDVPEFRNCDSENQGLDNTKHLVLTQSAFPIPADGVGRFAVDLLAENLDASGDYRHGAATLTLVDFETAAVFNILSTGPRVFAEQEILEMPGQENPFTRVIDDPFFLTREDLVSSTEPRRCEIEIDRSRRQIVYRVNDRVLHVAAGVENLPKEVHMAFGIFTLLPLAEGSSCHGQGGRASWSNFRYSTFDGS